MDEQSRLRGCEGYGIRFDDIPSPSCFAIHLPRGGGRLRRGIASADAKIPRCARNDRRRSHLRICHSEERSDEESFSARRRNLFAGISGNRRPPYMAALRLLQRACWKTETHRTIKTRNFTGSRSGRLNSCRAAIYGSRTPVPPAGETKPQPNEMGAV